MDLLKLQYFLCVASSASMEEAAGVLNVSQSTLSMAVKKLEEELGEKVMTTVATGGLAKDLVKSCKRDIIYNGELILYGLKVLYDKNNK